MRKVSSSEAAFAHLSANATRWSGEVLAANVLAATIMGSLGVETAIAEQARALLARVKLEAANAHENARVMAVAEARLETLLGELNARHLKH